MAAAREFLNDRFHSGGPHEWFWILIPGGLVLPLHLLQLMEVRPGLFPASVVAWDRSILTTLLMLAGALIPPLLLRRTFKRETPASKRFWRMMLAWSPMMAAGFASYQLSYVPAIRDIMIRISGLGAYGATVPLLALARTAVLGVGLAVCAVVLWKSAKASAEEARRGPEPAGAAGIAAFWILLLAFAWAA